MDVNFKSECQKSSYLQSIVRIGLETAVYLAKKKFIVYGCSRRLDRMQPIISAGGFALKLDVTNENDINVVEHVIKIEKKIDVLWNNAGFGLWGAVEDISIDRAKYQFDVNLFGLARMTKEASSHEKKNSGLIINTSSVGGKIYTPLGLGITQQNACLEGWFDCLGFEVKKFGINISLLQPGMIVSEFGNIII